MQPTDIVPYLAVIWLAVTDPTGAQVAINAREIVSLRNVTGSESLADGVHCQVSTLDGKYLAVIETCREVIEGLVEAAKKAGQ